MGADLRSILEFRRLKFARLSADGGRKREPLTCEGAGTWLIDLSTRGDQMLKMGAAAGIALAALMFLVAVGYPQTPDERANVRRIHDRIQQRAKKTAGKAEPYKVTIPNTTISYSMVPIPAGEFTMGSASGPKDEQPAHKVRVDAFWMQAHEVTWDEYRLFMFASQGGETASKDEVVDAVSRPTKPYVEMSFGMGIDGFPGISMTQHAANKYAEWLSARTGEFYRLPTEAEWEYACRAGAPRSEE